MIISEVRVLPPLLRIEEAFTQWVKAFFRCGLLRKGVEEGGGTRQSFRADSGLTVKVSATASSRTGFRTGGRGFSCRGAGAGALQKEAGPVLRPVGRTPTEGRNFIHSTPKFIHSGSGKGRAIGKSHYLCFRIACSANGKVSDYKYDERSGAYCPGADRVHLFRRQLLHAHPGRRRNPSAHVPARADRKDDRRAARSRRQPLYPNRKVPDHQS